MSDRVMALIPARGGSKGIPRKNLLMIAGKPLIAYTILQALAATRINRVIVSTDDEEIARVSREWGAEVPFVRPSQFAGDHSPDIDVFRHALEWLAQTEGYQPEMVVHLRPTCPMRRIDLIDGAIASLADRPDADAVRSVSHAALSPYKMWRIDTQGNLNPLLTIDGVTDSQSLPRQQLPQVYWQNGYVDVLRPRAVLDKNSMWGTCAIPLLIEDPVLELDYAENIPEIEEAIRRSESGIPLNHGAVRERHAV